MVEKLNHHSTNLNINKILIIFRHGTSRARKVAIELLDWVRQRGLEGMGWAEQNWPEGTKVITDAQELDSVDLVVVLGGDGTYLEAVRLLAGRRTPILGINLGSLGFLTETRLEDLHNNLEMTLSGHMEMRPRSMISVQVLRDKELVTQCSALNDIVIERGGGGHMVTLSTFIDDQHVCDYKADGLIVATPTGSTAYNLAAGGPILYPEAQSIVVTPICPHSLTNRPIIFPDSDLLMVKLKKGRNGAVLTVDGRVLSHITDAYEIRLQKDPCQHFVLRKPSHNYFDLLREKLNFGVRAVF